MMHGQKNIKLNIKCYIVFYVQIYLLHTTKNPATHILKSVS